MAINLIAVWFFIGVADDALAIVLRHRTLLLTVLGIHLHHYAAIFGYLVLLQIKLLLGVGLLDRKSWARTGAMILCAFVAINRVVTFLMPGSFERYLAFEQDMFPGVDMNGPAIAAARVGHLLSTIAAVTLSFVVLYFLWSRRGVFARGEIAVETTQSAEGGEA